ncbi:MAG TPA: ABC transporter permease [Clostridiales bacterium]|nr:ABC transporter permease [Clostridiales bacterium]
MNKRNPLRKRLLRELKSEIGKYLVIFLLLTASIGFVSGFLVADGSMMIAYDESFEKYNIEHGSFQLANEMNRAQRKAIESNGVTIYDNDYIEEELDNGSTIRLYANREEVNKLCLMKGKMPETADEIAVDRMYAENNHIAVGDTIGNQTHTWKVTGLAAFSDYSCLFSDNDDSMFDSVKFGVGALTKEGYARLDQRRKIYRYAWKYAREPADEQQEKEWSEDLMKVINAETDLEDFIPRYLNKAIQFTGEDLGSDRSMMIALLYIIIVIMAFVFGVTVSNTISKEAAVIGTLRASGYTRGELVRHYISMPLLVTFVSAIVGNILGYTVFKNVCVMMYYGSYSLPTYETIWSAEAFVLTTAVPVLLMIAINVLVLRRKLKLSPLKFLRRDLTRRRQKRAVKLSPRIPFFSRFRLRVIFQNAGNYVILMIGILFANLLLMFGLALPDVLDHYQDALQNNLLCNYQYMLKVPMNAMDEEHKLRSLIAMLQFRHGVRTEQEEAEAFSAYALNTQGEGLYPSESVVLYGVDEDSRYIKDIGETDIKVSSAYAEKFGLQAGDTITLKEEYEDTTYDFTITGVYDYIGAIAVFMNRGKLNETFDLGDDYYCGYFTDTPITDIDAKYIGSVTSLDDLIKISRQLDVSMGSMMYLVEVFAILIFMVLVYLLSKIIIEKNAQSISMTKILGYTNREIGGLYIVSTTIVVVLCLLLSLPLEYWIMYLIFRVMMMTSISGWIPFVFSPMLYVKMFAMGIVTYAVVALLEYRKVRSVPMDEALKNVE